MKTTIYALMPARAVDRLKVGLNAVLKTRFDWNHKLVPVPLPESKVKERPARTMIDAKKCMEDIVG